jgi:hypothetical protein
MKVKTTHLLITIPLILVALSKGELIRNSLKESATIQQGQMDFSSQIRQSKEETKQAQKLSEIALQRLKSNCIKTVDFETKKQTYYQIGAEVLDAYSKKPVREGAFICSAVGDTAIIRKGAISEIARVSLKDQPEYDSLFTKGIKNGKKSRAK